MPAPRRRYCRLPLGYLDDLGVSAEATLALARLHQAPIRRRIPGVSRAGEAGAAEALQMPAGKARKVLRELEAAGLVLFDRNARVLFVLGAVEADPPRNENVLKAWGEDLGELPACGVTDAIRDEIRQASIGLSTKEPLPKQFQEPTPNSSDNSRGIPNPPPLPVPVSKIQEPLPPPPTAPKLVEAWNRLGAAFPEAAEADLVGLQISEEVEGVLGHCLNQLATSFFLSDRARKPPTLHRLLSDAEFRRKLAAGDYYDPQVRWRCASCSSVHPPLEDCQPRCRGCGGNHQTSQDCAKLRELEREEQDQADIDALQRENPAMTRGEAYAIVEERRHEAVKAMIEERRQRRSFPPVKPMHQVFATSKTAGNRAAMEAFVAAHAQAVES